MQGEQEGPAADERFDELIERLRSLGLRQPSGSLSELAYRRARDALEKALEDSATIRLQALADARATREREVAILAESIEGLRQAAEADVAEVMTSARIEAERLRAQARGDAEAMVEAARRQADAALTEARAVREAADTRAAEVERLEAEFNGLVDRFAKRVGMGQEARGGWMRRLFRRG